MGKGKRHGTLGKFIMQDDEGVQLAAKLNAQIMSLKLGFTESSTTLRAGEKRKQLSKRGDFYTIMEFHF